MPFDEHFTLVPNHATMKVIIQHFRINKNS